MSRFSIEKDVRNRIAYSFSAHLVESIKFGSRAQSLRILTKQHLGRRSRVDHDDRDIPQLNLIHGTKLLRPRTILLRRVDPDLGQISNQWKAGRALQTLDSGRRPNELVENDIEQRGQDSGDSEGMPWVLDDPTL